MREKLKPNSIETPASLLIFAVFTFCIVATLLAGAGAYRRLSERDSEAYEARTAMQYIATKIANAEAPDCIRLSKVGDANALCIEESSGYASSVYFYDGWLRELYARADTDAAPEAGEKLMQLSAVDFSLENGLLQYTVVTSGGKVYTGYRSVRGGEAAA